MKLSDEDKEKLRSLLVEVVLELRSAYLRTTGCNVLKHWTTLQERMLAAARQSESPEEWITKMSRTLQLGAPMENSSRSYRDLADFVRERSASSEFLDLIEREYGFILAQSRGVAEQRKEASHV